MKTKSFEFPFIGYDYAREHGWKMEGSMEILS